MKKGPGSGWHKESERHSRARKYGSAGGSYKRRTNATRQKDESYCQRCSGPIDEPGLCGVCEAERLADEEFDMTSEVRPEDRAETWKYPADDRMEITRRNGKKYLISDKAEIESILWHDGISIGNVIPGDTGRMRA